MKTPQNKKNIYIYNKKEKKSQDNFKILFMYSKKSNIYT